MLKNTCSTDCTVGAEDNVCQLHLEISSVQFSHHPLFSCEHVMSSRLEKAYQHYCDRDEKAADYCNEKVSTCSVLVVLIQVVVV